MRTIPDSWIAEYLRYTEGQESPELFHMWIGTAVVAGVLERNVWLDRGYYRLYPNLYVILVAGSAVCRKSVAVGIGTRLLRDLPNPPHIIAQKVTPEALIQALSRQGELADNRVVLPPSAGIIDASELSVFLGRAAHDSGMLALLTDFYDCPDKFTYETRTQGKVELERVSLTMLGASTPEWLKGSVPEDAIGGGFLSRCVLVYQDTPKPPIPFPVVTPEMEAMRERLLKDLQAIRQLRGQFSVSHSAQAWYADWYTQEVAELQRESLGEFLVRRPDVMLKVAMVLSACESDSLVIEPRHLMAAQGMLDEVKKNLPKVVDPIVTNTQADPTRRVLDLLRRYGKMRRSDLLRHAWRFANAETITQAIDTLSQAGVVEVRQEGKGLTYRLVEEALEEISKTEKPELEGG